MPSPIAHLAAAYAVYELARRHGPEPNLRPLGPLPGLLAVTAAFSMMPDVDSVVGLIAGDFGRFHNNATHSLIVGTVVALGFAGVMRWLKRGQFFYWFSVALVCYSMHIAMDAATFSRGVMAFWPLTDERYLLPITAFYGLHWSNGLFSIRHLWTLFTELLFVALVVVLLHRWPRRAKAQA
ncbi:MAG: metal-dependent hydrolase [Caldilinea sp.]